MLNRILNPLTIGAFQALAVMSIWAVAGTVLVVYAAKGF